MNTTIKFGVIGFGSIAKNHLLASYDANLRLNLPFTIKPHGVLVRKQTDTRLTDVPAYTRFEDFKEQLDFIDICTPNNAHLEYVQAAAENNLAIYCEKPLACDLQTVTQMYSLAQQHSLINGCAFMYRMLPAVHLLKQHLASGSIGKIISFRASMFHSSYLNLSKAGWRTGADSGGGALLDLGIHLIDLVHFIVGDIVDISAETNIHFKQRSMVDEYAFCKVRTENGINGSIEVSRISAETNNRDCFEIFGEKGSLMAHMKQPYSIECFTVENNQTTHFYADDALLNRLHYPVQRAYLGFFQSAHTASLVEFAASVYNNKQSDVLASFEDGLKAQRVVENAYTT